MSEKSKNKESSIDSIIDNTFSKLKNIVDANIVVGKEICVGNAHVIPISKISVGLLTGGGNLSKKSVSAGSGSGFNIIPVGFITIQDSLINYLPVNNDLGVNKILDGLFKIYDVMAGSKDNSGESHDEE
ncbi:MAG: hypothetical protein E7354_01765 [Clostridiales bacterium]|nr:hypothetical protein [Clostridiales bacterium]